MLNNSRARFIKSHDILHRVLMPQCHSLISVMKNIVLNIEEVGGHNVEY
jgi:hypothetical protein